MYKVVNFSGFECAHAFMTSDLQVTCLMKVFPIQGLWNSIPSFLTILYCFIQGINPSVCYFSRGIRKKAGLVLFHKYPIILASFINDFYLYLHLYTLYIILHCVWQADTKHIFCHILTHIHWDPYLKFLFVYTNLLGYCCFCCIQWVSKSRSPVWRAILTFREGLVPGRIRLTMVPFTSDLIWLHNSNYCLNLRTRI